MIVQELSYCNTQLIHILTHTHTHRHISRSTHTHTHKQTCMYTVRKLLTGDTGGANGSVVQRCSRLDRGRLETHRERLYTHGFTQKLTDTHVPPSRTYFTFPHAYMISCISTQRHTKAHIHWNAYGSSNNIQQTTTEKWPKRLCTRMGISIK